METMDQGRQMIPFREIFEDAMTTVTAGLKTGEEIADDDMRVPSGEFKIQSRVKPTS